MGLLICGLNGTGKSTPGRMLADRMGYEFIDNEDLFFPKTDTREKEYRKTAFKRGISGFKYSDPSLRIN